MADPAVRRTAIPGLLVVDLVVHADPRGWFKENWQREKMVALGLPDFSPVQNNVAFNAGAGVTRGVHAEPWDKLVSVTSGRVFGAWVDLRAGKTFGQVVTLELGPQTAVFVARGVGNAYQTLEPGTSYSYLVNEHWSARARDGYTFVNVADETLAIAWPIPLADAELSAADRTHPPLADVRPVPPRRTLVLGAGGQVGLALRQALPDAIVLDRDDVDLADPASRRAGLDAVDWTSVGAVVNAAAYTAVDAAETPEGRRAAWAVNVAAVADLVARARRHRLVLVHLSSDYVFDGTRPEHAEDEPVSPLGVYGQTKAAGDALVAGHAEHYLVRTSWVVGEGRNFVATMADLADRGVSPSVIDDQHGRLTFADQLAAGIVHLLRSGRDRAPYGTYNLTGSGAVQSWADIAASVFTARGRSASDVTRVSTEQYRAGTDRGRPVAPRPRHSALTLDKITATGFRCEPVAVSLERYLAELPTRAPA